MLLEVEIKYTKFILNVLFSENFLNCYFFLLQVFKNGRKESQHELTEDRQLQALSELSGQVHQGYQSKFVFLLFILFHLNLVKIISFNKVHEIFS